MSKHQKRISAPRSWPIPKKTHKWSVRPRPGPHRYEDSIALTLIVRDILGLADNTREARRIISEGSILVDMNTRRDHKYPVGIFDSISVPALDQQYRVLLDKRGAFMLIPTEDADLKLAKVTRKQMVKGGRIQLGFHDGTTLLADNDVNTGDTLILRMPDREVVKHVPFDSGSLAMVMGGTHAGTLATVKERRLVKAGTPNMVVLEDDGEFETVEDYVFIVGEDEPEINLGVVEE